MSDELDTPAILAAEAELEAALQQAKDEPQKSDENSTQGGEGSKNNEPPELEEKPEPKQAQKPQGKPEGYDPVDLSDLPEEIRAPIEKRFGHLYKQIKASDEKNRIIPDLLKQNQELEKTLDYLMQQDQSRGQKDALAEYSEAEAATLAAIEDARNYGETKREAELMAHYAELKRWKVDYDASLRQPPQKPQKQESQPQAAQPYTPEEAAYVAGLTKETAEDGTPLRPWLNKGDAGFEKALDLAKKITIELESKGVEKPSIYQIMPRLEKYMNAKAASQSSVLSGDLGNLTPPAKNKNNGLSDDQRFVSKKLGIDLKSMGVDTERQMAKIAKATRVRLEDIV